MHPVYTPAMSWSGSNHFDGTRPRANTRIATVFTEPDDKRQAARALYNQGDIDGAADRAGEIMISGEATADDYLFMGLIHHALRNPSAGIALLQDGIARFPGNPAIHENLAVSLLLAGAHSAAVEAANAAFALGADSPNLYDCLAEAQERLGRPDLAIEAGRTALEMKDARFSQGAQVANIPPGRPRPFDPSEPERNLIVYTLWGNDPRYQVPLATNARILPHLFPGWTMRVYHDPDVDAAFLQELAGNDVQLVGFSLPQGVPAVRRLLWRFEPIADPTVHRFLIRDADSLLTVKERVAVDAWLASACYFHTMRDWYTHTDLLLAGMWGGVGGILPSPATLLGAYSHWRVETNHIDQDLLTDTVWPVVRHSILIHDSIFMPCLGSVPFPPFGAQPPGHHIGQNAFLNFSKSG
jgi:tetratricopeptide (TPR) repeat protein